MYTKYSIKMELLLISTIILITSIFIGDFVYSDEVTGSPKEESNPKSETMSRISKYIDDQISADFNPDTLVKIDSDIVILANAFANHADNERRVGSYLTGTQAGIRRIIFNMTKFSPEYSEYIYAKSKSKVSKVDIALLIVLGLSKDSRVHDDIKNIVLYETDPNLRAIAVRAISYYMDTLDVPILIQALSDSNTVTMEVDVQRRDGTFSQQVNLVCIEAIPALYRFGYDVIIDPLNSGKLIVKKRP
jgi:hypothetical protein